MRPQRKLTTLAMTAVLVLSVLATGAVGAASAGNSSLSVGVSQADDGSATVSVTQNGTGVDGAAVSVAVDGNGTYEGAGDYTTDNGTVGLPAPEEDVTVTIEANYDNQSDSTTATLVAENGSDNRSENATDAFGANVSSFVHSLLSSENTTNESIGQQVSAFVTANNPGADKRPDHAGPDGNKTQGPPADKGPNKDDKPQGPPEDKGSNKDKGEDHPSNKNKGRDA